jgi:EmrB/QacA subfamily drug resistance transporter
MTSESRKWFALAIICVGQFIVVLDVSIVNVALPSIERGLHFSQQNLLWILSAYALIFGGFLMLGGRLADKLGRRRVFVAGVVLFSVASLFCGLATSSGWLVTARAVQGLGAAILSPAALSILMVTFKEGRERNRALSIWGAIAGAGGAVGALLGGILTQEVGWRWIFYVNVPIGSLVVVAAIFILASSRSEAEARGFDIPGAIVLTTGLVLMVFALVKSTSWGWASSKTLGCFAVAIILIAAFILIERRTESPLVPLSIFGNRSLSASNLVSLALGASVFSMFYFLSLYMQQVLGYSPLRTGVAFLVIAIGIVIAAGAAQPLVARFGIRSVMTVGMLMVCGGLIYFTQISPNGTFVGDLLPGFTISGVGLGLAFVPVTIGAVSRVAADQAGVASGLVTTTQQIGGAFGIAVPSTVAISVTSRFASSHGSGHAELIAGLSHGFALAFWVGAAFAAVGAIVAWFGMKPSLATVNTGSELAGESAHPQTAAA